MSLFQTMAKKIRRKAFENFFNFLIRTSFTSKSWNRTKDRKLCIFSRYRLLSTSCMRQKYHLGHYETYCTMRKVLLLTAYFRPSLCEITYHKSLTIYQLIQLIDRKCSLQVIFASFMNLLSLREHCCSDFAKATVQRHNRILFLTLPVF